MPGGPASGARHESREGGQILVLFCISVVAMLIALALLYDGARALVLRRQLQNAADAAALAAANVVQSGATPGCATNGLIRSAVPTAAKDSVKTNLGWTDATVASNVTVSTTFHTLYPYPFVTNGGAVTFGSSRTYAIVQGKT